MEQYLKKTSVKLKTISMARQSELGFTGRVANILFYEMRGQRFMRSAPGRVRQTKATKARSADFGKASTLGSLIRSHMSDLIPEPKDQTMQRSLVTALYQWLMAAKKQPDGLRENLILINDFQFNKEGSPLNLRWKPNTEVSNPANGIIDIAIPSFVPVKSIQAPAYTKSVTCRFAVCVIDMDKLNVLAYGYRNIDFDYNDQPVDAQVLSMNLKTPKNSFLFTGLSLEYNLTKDGQIKKNLNNSFMPSGIFDIKPVL